MRTYTVDEERAIRTERMVREWTRSGLLDKAQEDRILSELKVDLRRTNLFFRLLLFAFGLLIIFASVALVGLMGHINDGTAIAVLCAFGAACSLALAEFLIANFRLYRFGIEEASAIAGGTLLALSVVLLGSVNDWAVFSGLIVGSVAGLVIYIRYGYVYAAIASMVCLSLAPFQTELSQAGKRLAAAGMLLAVFAIARLLRGKYGTIQAVAWVGVYAYLNLHLSFLRSSVVPPDSFYWFTYGAIWFLPAIGLFLGFRGRDRLLLDLNIALSLVTLITNKLYLGAQRQTWDPILLGIFLIAVALAIKRWLAAGDRKGLTAARILVSDKSRIAAVGIASTALHTVPQMPSAPAPDRMLDPGGGRSGGGGASGSF